MADSIDQPLHDVEMDVKAEPTATTSGSRKRRLLQDEIAGPSKRVPIDIEFTAYDVVEAFNLLDFSDEVLLEILLHCNSITLQALTKTCRRFESLVGDRRLWKTFDFSKKKMMGKEIKYLLKYVTKETKDFKVRGLVSKYPLDKHKNNTLTTAILAQLRAKCHDLETFEVHEGFLNFEQIQIAQFPEMLKRLVFNGCLIKQPRSPKVLNKIDQHLHFLEELSLEKCNWFETHDLVVLSKLSHLKRLNLRGCPSLKELVPYGSIAARFGFKSLETLDIRDTQVSDSDIQCFNITMSLREILMECPPNLRDTVTPDKNEAVAVANQRECEASTSKEVIEQSTATANKTTDSDVETGSEMDGEDSEEEDDDDIADDKNGANEENGNENGSAASSSQNHYIQVIIHEGNLLNVNNGQIPSDQMQRARANGLRYMVGLVNREGPVEVLQRHVEERQEQLERRERQDAVIRARIDLVARAELRRREPSPSSSHERPKTREIETQTDKAVNAVDTRPNETQTDPCTKSTDGADDANNTDDNVNKPSTSASAAGVIGMPGPSNRNNDFESKAESTGEQQSAASGYHRSQPEAENEDEQPPAVMAEPEQAAEMQPNPNVEPNPNAEADGQERRQRLIIIHQRRHDDDDNLQNRFRRISWEINNRPPALPYLRHLNRLQMGYTGEAPVSHLHLISDRGLCSFGMPRNNVQEGIVWIRAEQRPADTLLERITVRNYRAITDVTLRHLASCAPNLRYLDVTGTSVTASGISQFSAAKPNCEVIWSEN